MDFKIKSTGNLKKLAKNAEAMKGTQEIKLPELMNNSFISQCSQFSSLDELIDASGFKVESKEDFEAIPDKEWDDFIKKNTSYENWQEMQKAAGSEYAKEQLFKGIK